MQKTDIKNYTPAGMENILISMGQPKYRANQVFGWIFREGIHDFSRMTNLPKALTQELDNRFFISIPNCVEESSSRDGTIKLLFLLDDGLFIESVLISSKNRKTICLSTQAGCRFRCSFCASGMDGFKRNLRPAEMINQVMYAKNTLKLDITNYVFMGMGEPLDNYDNLVEALKIMNDEKGLHVGARRITISTCGIITGIKKLADLDMQVNLSLSLHAVTNESRSMLMPVNKRFPLEKLVAAMQCYGEKKNRIITLEYILIPGVNDAFADAEGLARIARHLKAKINLIPCSPIKNFKFKTPDKYCIERFIGKVKGYHAYINLRESKGNDIMAACGQLALKRKKARV